MISAPIRQSIRQSIVKSLRGENIDILHGREATIVNSPWVDNGDFTYSIDGSQAGGTNIEWGEILAPNTNYIVVVSVSGRTAGGVRPQNGDFLPSFASSNGDTEYLFTNVTNNKYLIRGDSDFDGTVSSTVRKQ